MLTVEGKLKEMGIELSTPPKPAASYVPTKRVGNLIYLSGQDCRKNGVLVHQGKVGSDLTVQQGYEAARRTAINILSVLKVELGELNKIKQIVKILAFVNSADGFVEQPYVINGASDFLEQVLGEKGKHARSAIGTNELPFNTPVEIEIIVEVED